MALRAISLHPPGARCETPLLSWPGRMQRVCLAVCAVLLAISGSVSPPRGASLAAAVTRPAPGVAFEENRGQVDGSVEYLARSHDFYTALTPGGALLFPGGRKPGRLLLQFPGSTAVHGVAE